MVRLLSGAFLINSLKSPIFRVVKKPTSYHISPSRIKTFGIPIDPKFASSHNKEELAKKFGINPQNPIILTMGGGQGLGPINRVVSSFKKSRVDSQLIVVTGTNKKLYRSIKRKIKKHRKKILLFKFINNIDELMEISTLIITKAGGLTTAEALSKKLPILILKPLPGQEETNTNYFLEEGAAIKINKKRKIYELIQRIISNPGQLRRMQEATQRLSKPNASLDIAKFIHSRPENRAIYGADEEWPLSISLRETAGFSPRSFIYRIMFNYILYRLGEFLAVNLPLKAGYAITNAISFLRYLFSKQDRTSVRNNLKIILPQEKASVREKYTIGVFSNFGKYLLEFFRFSKIDRGFIDKHVVIEGLNNMDDALSDKNGAIIVAGHIGNYELGAAALGLLGYKVNAIALVHKYKKVDDFFNSKRIAKGIRIFPLGKEAIWNCLEAFKRNEIVCLISDRDFTIGGIEIDFLGRQTIIPKGPAAFSLKSKTPIVPAFAIRLSDNKFRFFMTPPIRYTPCGELDKDIYALTKLYLKEIEKVIFEYPDQWYMFRKFWLR